MKLTRLSKWAKPVKVSLPVLPFLVLGALYLYLSPSPSIIFLVNLIFYISYSPIALWDGNQGYTCWSFFVLHFLVVSQISELVYNIAGISMPYRFFGISFGVRPYLFFASIIPCPLIAYWVSTILESRLSELIESREKQPVKAIHIPTGWRNNLDAIGVTVSIIAFSFLLLNSYFPQYARYLLSASTVLSISVIFLIYWWFSFYHPQIDNPLRLVYQQFKIDEFRNALPDSRLQKVDELVYYSLLQRINESSLIEQCTILDKVLPVLEGLRDEGRRDVALKAVKELADCYDEGVGKLLLFLGEFPGSKFKSLKSFKNVVEELQLKSKISISIKEVKLMRWGNILPIIVGLISILSQIFL